jgi:hypothetical protein
MGSFLKKVTIGTLCTLLFVGLFWSSISATAFWSLALYQTRELPSTRTLPSETVILGSATEVFSYTTYETLSIPEVFSDTTVLNKSETIIVLKDKATNASYSVSTMAPFAVTYTSNPNYTAEEMTQMCVELTTLFADNPCTSNQNFVSNLMQTSSDFAGLFSNNKRKTLGGTLLILKGTYLPVTTTEITPFQTDTISGYIAYGPEQSVAYVFGVDGAGYELAFIQMDRNQIDTVLSAINNVADK